MAETCAKCGQGFAWHSQETCDRNLKNQQKEQAKLGHAVEVAVAVAVPRAVKASGRRTFTMTVLGGLVVLVITVCALFYFGSSSAAPAATAPAAQPVQQGQPPQQAPQPGYVVSPQPGYPAPGNRPRHR